jgi:hypothetical protein
MRKAIRLVLVIPVFILMLLLSGALMNAQTATADPQSATQSGPPTVAEAEQFIHDVRSIAARFTATKPLAPS